MPINSTLCFFFSRLDDIKNLRISFYLFVRFLFNFTILRSRTPSLCFGNQNSKFSCLAFLFLQFLGKQTKWKHEPIISLG